MKLSAIVGVLFLALGVVPLSAARDRDANPTESKDIAITFLPSDLNVLRGGNVYTTFSIQKGTATDQGSKIFEGRPISLQVVSAKPETLMVIQVAMSHPGTPLRISGSGTYEVVGQGTVLRVLLSQSVFASVNFKAPPPGMARILSGRTR